jgi:SAM-dependent methyltransferase
VNRFGEDSVDKMIQWCLKHTPSSGSPKVLEVGCGNGVLLLALAEHVYDPSLLFGVDYSENAVRLAEKVACGRDAAFSAIRFFVGDFLFSEKMEGSPYDLILDKGTFDAIALAKKDGTGTSLSMHYPRKVVEYLKPDGYFLITCKYTPLIIHFIPH